MKNKILLTHASVVFQLVAMFATVMSLFASGLLSAVRAEGGKFADLRMRRLSGKTSPSLFVGKWLCALTALMLSAGSAQAIDVWLHNNQNGSYQQTYSESFGMVPVTLKKSGTGACSVSVTFSAGSNGMVDWATKDVDYVAPNQVVSFASGDTQKTIYIVYTQDTLYEGNEWINVGLVGTGCNIIPDPFNTPANSYVINNDDPSTNEKATINDVSITEGNSGTKNLNFTVSRNATYATASVSYSTANGTATANSDYVSKSGTISWSNGENEKTLSIVINGDTTYENSEYFYVNLSNPVGLGGGIGDSQGRGTITNDDAAPTYVSIADATVTEGNSGTKVLYFTITRSGNTATTFAGGFSTSDGTATTADGDYNAASGGPIIFNAGQTTTQLGITVNGDTKYENNETFNVNIGFSGVTMLKSTGVGTITNDDSAPSFTINNATVTEGNSGTQNMTFTVTKSGSTALSSTVNYVTANNTATTGDSDYVAKSGTLTFAAGDTTKTFSVVINGDTKYENNETFYVNLTNPVRATIADSQGVGTINNNDSAPSFTINNATVTEGNSGTQNMTFTVTKSGSTGLSSTVNFATANNSATTGDLDYVAKSGTLTFAAGDTTKTISVVINGDTKYENNETFYVNLTNPVRATIADSQGVGTINNNDSAPTLAINNASVTEGASGTKTLTFTVTKTGSTALASSVKYVTANGTATAGSDYVALPLTTLNFAAGDTTKTFTVTINGDTTYEGNETFNVNLSAASGATIADATGVGTITNDDSAPTLAIGDATIAEGASGTKTLTFTVTKTSSTGLASSVSYATSNGTATAVEDYLATSGSLSFLAADTTKTITVTINGDTKYEANETFNVTLSGVSGATLADATGVGTITNDDSAPTLAIGDATIAEGASGTKTLTFTVTKTGSTGVTATVNYATSNGTATTGDSDYVGKSGSLSFAAGDTSKTISVVINGDTKYENNETFNVTLSAASGATIADATGVGTITNDDSVPTLAIADASVTEGNSGTKTLTFTVTKTGSSALASSVNYATSNGTATTGDSDYVAASGSLSFAAADTTKTFTVTINGDAKYENDETFNVTLSGVSGATIADGTAVGTITNDDSVPTLAINNASITEGNSGTKIMTFTVTRSASALASTVNFATSDDTATTADSDYVARSGSLSFAAGDTTKTITVTINGDTNYEADETFNVTLSGATGATISDATGVGTIVSDEQTAIVGITPPDGTVWSSGGSVYVQTVNADTVTYNGVSMTSLSDGLFTTTLGTGVLNGSTLTFVATGFTGTATATVSYTYDAVNGTYPENPSLTPVIAGITPPDATVWSGDGNMIVEAENTDYVLVNGNLMTNLGSGFFSLAVTAADLTGANWTVLAIGSAGTTTESVAYTYDAVNGTYPTTGSAPAITDVIPADGTVWSADGNMLVYTTGASGVMVEGIAMTKEAEGVFSLAVTAADLTGATWTIEAVGSGTTTTTVAYTYDPVNGTYPAIPGVAPLITGITPADGTVWSANGYMYVSASDALTVLLEGIQMSEVAPGSYSTPIVAADLTGATWTVKAIGDGGSSTATVAYTYDPVDGTYPGAAPVISSVTPPTGTVWSGDGNMFVSAANTAIVTVDGVSMTNLGDGVFSLPVTAANLTGAVWTIEAFGDTGSTTATVSYTYDAVNGTYPTTGSAPVITDIVPADGTVWSADGNMLVFTTGATGVLVEGIAMTKEADGIFSLAVTAADLTGATWTIEAIGSGTTTASVAYTYDAVNGTYPATSGVAPVITGITPADGTVWSADGNMFVTTTGALTVLLNGNVMAELTTGIYSLPVTAADLTGATWIVKAIGAAGTATTTVAYTYDAVDGTYPGNSGVAPVITEITPADATVWSGDGNMIVAAENADYVLVEGNLLTDLGGGYYSLAVTAADLSGATWTIEAIGSAGTTTESVSYTYDAVNGTYPTTGSAPVITDIVPADGTVWSADGNMLVFTTGATGVLVEGIAMTKESEGIFSLAVTAADLTGATWTIEAIGSSTTTTTVAYTYDAVNGTYPATSGVAPVITGITPADGTVWRSNGYMYVSVSNAMTVLLEGSPMTEVTAGNYRTLIVASNLTGATWTVQAIGSGGSTTESVSYTYDAVDGTYPGAAPVISDITPADGTVWSADGNLFINAGNAAVVTVDGVAMTNLGDGLFSLPVTAADLTGATWTIEAFGGIGSTTDWVSFTYDPVNGTYPTAGSAPAITGITPPDGTVWSADGNLLVFTTGASGVLVEGIPMTKEAEGIFSLAVTAADLTGATWTIEAIGSSTTTESVAYTYDAVNGTYPETPGAAPVITGITPADGTVWSGDGNMFVTTTGALTVLVDGNAMTEVTTGIYSLAVTAADLTGATWTIKAIGSAGSATDTVDYTYDPVDGTYPENPGEVPVITGITPADNTVWSGDGNMIVEFENADYVLVNGNLMTDLGGGFFSLPVTAADLTGATWTIEAIGSAGTTTESVTYTYDPVNGTYPTAGSAPAITGITPPDGTVWSADGNMLVFTTGASGVLVEGIAMTKESDGIFSLAVTAADLTGATWTIEAVGSSTTTESVAYTYDAVNGTYPETPGAAPVITGITPADGTVWSANGYMYVSVSNAMIVLLEGTPMTEVTAGFYRTLIVASNLTGATWTVKAIGDSGSTSTTVAYTYDAVDGTYPGAAPVISEVTPADGTVWSADGNMFINAGNAAMVTVDGVAMTNLGDGLFSLPVTAADLTGALWTIEAFGGTGSTTDWVSFTYDPVNGTYPANPGVPPAIVDVVPADGTVWSADGYMFVSVTDAEGVLVNGLPMTKVTGELFSYAVTAADLTGATWTITAIGTAGSATATVAYTYDAVNGTYPANPGATPVITDVVPADGTVWSADGVMYVSAQNTTYVTVDGAVMTSVGDGLFSLAVDASTLAGVTWTIEAIGSAGSATATVSYTYDSVNGTYPENPGVAPTIVEVTPADGTIWSADGVMYVMTQNSNYVTVDGTVMSSVGGGLFSLSVTAADLTGATWTVQALGAAGSATTTVAYTYDAVNGTYPANPGVTPTIVEVMPADGTVWSADGTMFVSAEDAAYVTVDGTVMSSVNDGFFSLNVTAANLTGAIWTVEAFGGAGSASTTVAYTYDSANGTYPGAAPVILEVIPADGTVWSDDGNMFVFTENSEYVTLEGAAMAKIGEGLFSLPVTAADLTGATWTVEAIGGNGSTTTTVAYTYDPVNGTYPVATPAITEVTPIDGSIWRADGNMFVSTTDAEGVLIEGVPMTKLTAGLFTAPVTAIDLTGADWLIEAIGENGSATTTVAYTYDPVNGTYPGAAPAILNLTPADGTVWRANGYMLVTATNTRAVLVDGNAMEQVSTGLFRYQVMAAALTGATWQVEAIGGAGSDTTSVAYTYDSVGGTYPGAVPAIVAVTPDSGTVWSGDGDMYVLAAHAEFVTVDGVPMSKVGDELFSLPVTAASLTGAFWTIQAYGGTGTVTDWVSYTYDPVNGTYPDVAPVVVEVTPADGTVWGGDGTMYVSAAHTEYVTVEGVLMIEVGDGLFSLDVTAAELTGAIWTVEAFGGSGTATTTVAYTYDPVNGTYPVDSGAPAAILEVTPPDSTVWRADGNMFVSAANTEYVTVNGVLMTEVSDGVFSLPVTAADLTGATWTIKAFGGVDTDTDTVSYTYDPVNGTYPSTTAPSIVAVMPVDGSTWNADGTMFVSTTGAVAVLIEGNPATMVHEGLFSFPVTAAELTGATWTVEAFGESGSASTTVAYTYDPVNGTYPGTTPVILNVSPADGSVWQADGTMTVSVSDAVTVEVNGVPMTMDSPGIFTYPVTLSMLPATLTIEAIGVGGSETTTVDYSPTIYEAWSRGNFSHAFVNKAMGVDPEGDDMDNSMEFAFGTDPTVTDIGPLAADGSANGKPMAMMNAAGDGLELMFIRRKDHGTEGSMAYTVQFSTDLKSWADSTGTPTWVADSSVHSDYEVVKVSFPELFSSGERKYFGRVVITPVEYSAP